MQPIVINYQNCKYNYNMTQSTNPGYLKTLKPATHYQSQIRLQEQQQQEHLLREQIPLITQACRQFDQDSSQPVVVTLKQPLAKLLLRELMEKGYRVDQMQVYHGTTSTMQYQIKISIGHPNETYFDPLEDLLDHFGVLSSASSLPQLLPSPKYQSQVQIEEIVDEQPSMPQKVSKTQPKVTQQPPVSHKTQQPKVTKAKTPMEPKKETTSKKQSMNKHT